MDEYINISPAEGLWVVRAGGAVIGESRNALMLTEGDYPTIVYFPRGDIGMAFLEPSETRENHPHMGDASFFSIQTKSVLLKDAAWSYESPNKNVAEIAGHLAFYATDKVAVERL